MSELTFSFFAVGCETRGERAAYICNTVDAEAIHQSTEYRNWITNTCASTDSNILTGFLYCRENIELILEKRNSRSQMENGKLERDSLKGLHSKRGKLLRYIRRS